MVQLGKYSTAKVRLFQHEKNQKKEQDWTRRLSVFVRWKRKRDTLSYFEIFCQTTRGQFCLIPLYNGTQNLNSPLRVLTTRQARKCKVIKVISRPEMPTTWGTKISSAVKLLEFAFYGFNFCIASTLSLLPGKRFNVTHARGTFITRVSHLYCCCHGDCLFWKNFSQAKLVLWYSGYSFICEIYIKLVNNMSVPKLKLHRIDYIQCGTLKGQSLQLLPSKGAKQQQKVLFGYRRCNSYASE